MQNNRISSRHDNKKTKLLKASSLKYVIGFKPTYRLVTAITTISAVATTATTETTATTAATTAATEATATAAATEAAAWTLFFWTSFVNR
jgi:hypothetical protein